MNILLTSVGRRTYMVHYFKEALSGYGHVHAANSVMTYTMTQADKFILTPNIYDDQYIDFLIDYCRENEISAVISLFDIDLPILSKAKGRFQQHGIHVIVSDLDTIQVCNDKWASYEMLINHGLSTPQSFLTISDVKEAISSKKITYPVIVKPRWGMGSIGIFQADNELELEVFYHKLKRNIFDTYLKYESDIDKEHCIIIQEKISGDEYGLDILNDLKSHYVTTIAKQKNAMRAGETDVATIVSADTFIPIAMKISDILKHVANLDVDCFVTSQGEIYVLEMNCRFGGQYPFSHLAGADFPKQIIEWIRGQGTSIKNINPLIGVMGCKDLTPIII